MARILSLGITALDMVLGVDAMPAGEGKYYASRRRDVLGGIAANAALAMARLGADTALASRIGDDPQGEKVMAWLAEGGVDTGWVEWLPGASTSGSAVIVDAEGERMLVNHADAALFRGPAFGLDLAGFDAIMTDTRWMDGAAPALAEARERGLPALVDFDRMPEEGAGPYLELASHVAFASQGLEGLTGERDPVRGLERAREMSPAILSVTAGAHGVWWHDGESIRHQPAFAVEASDTLAAGDVFHGALAVMLAERTPFEDALRFASAAAALKCLTFGGASGTPSREAVERFMAEDRSAA